MRAAICTKYGKPDVLQFREVDRPVPGDNEICIKVYATAVTASDIFIRSSNLPLRFKIPMRLFIGIQKPRRSIIGLVFSGKVHAIGKHVTRFKQGDKVYGLTGFHLGAYAEYLCLEDKDSKHGCIAHKPQNISHEEATMIAYGGLLSLQFLERGNIQPGDKVLIYGASGTSGTIAIQIAKSMGAEITAVCSTSNLSMVKELGADYVMDYTNEDSIPKKIKYDLIFDSVGKIKTSKLKVACKKALSPQGKYVSIDDGALALDSLRLDKLSNYVESGIIKPVIDRCYPFEELVEAHRYVEGGHKIGGVAITIKNDFE